MVQRLLRVPDRLSPAWTFAIAAAVSLLDYLVAPADFPALFFFPVLFAAWYGGLRWALPFVLLPFVQVFNSWLAGAGGDQMYVDAVAAGVRSVMMTPIVIWIAEVSAAQRALQREVEILEGLLPICSYCKRIRDDDGKWQVLEKYIEENSEATFTHGICESCLREEEVAWKRA